MTKFIGIIQILEMYAKKGWKITDSETITLDKKTKTLTFRLEKQ